MAAKIHGEVPVGTSQIVLQTDSYGPRCGSRILQVLETRTASREQLLATWMCASIERAEYQQTQQPWTAFTTASGALNVQAAAITAVWSMVPSISSSSRAWRRNLCAGRRKAYLDIARAQFDLIIQVLVFALIPDLGRPALALRRRQRECLPVITPKPNGTGTAVPITCCRLS